MNALKNDKTQQPDLLNATGGAWTTCALEYLKPELMMIGSLGSVRAKPGNGFDHNDSTYFQYREL